MKIIQKQEQYVNKLWKFMKIRWVIPDHHKSLRPFRTHSLSPVTAFVQKTSISYWYSLKKGASLLAVRCLLSLFLFSFSECLLDVIFLKKKKERKRIFSNIDKSGIALQLCSFTCLEDSDRWKRKMIHVGMEIT